MKKLLYLFIILGMTSVSAQAYIDSNYMTSEQFLINRNFSKLMFKTIQSQTKDPYAPLVEKTDTRSVYEKIYHYIDPAGSGDYYYPVHNIKFNSDWEDL